MPTSAIVSLALFVTTPILAPQDQAPPKIIKSAIVIGKPTQEGNTVTVPVKLTLGVDDTEFKGFAFMAIICDRDGKKTNQPALVQRPPYQGPKVGKSVNTHVTFKAIAGVKYQLEASMTYLNGAKAPVSKEVEAKAVGYQAK